MSKTGTTLSAAVALNDLTINVASGTGFFAPTANAGTIPGSGGVAPYCYVQVDTELMKVTGVNGTIISVKRGISGTVQSAHASGAVVLVGLPTDFPYFETVAREMTPVLEVTGPENEPAVNLTGSADALDGSAGRYLITSGGVDGITIPTPTADMEGNVLEIISGSAHAHTVTAATACIGAGEAAKTVITFPAYAGAACKLVAHGAVWLLIEAGPGGSASAATGGTPIGSLVLS